MSELFKSPFYPQFNQFATVVWFKACQSVKKAENKHNYHTHFIPV